MTITKLGIYRMRGGGEARVAVLNSEYAMGFLIKDTRWTTEQWRIASGRIYRSEQVSDDLVELIREWPNG